MESESRFRFLPRFSATCTCDHIAEAGERTYGFAMRWKPLVFSVTALAGAIALSACVGPPKEGPAPLLVSKSHVLTTPDPEAEPGTPANPMPTGVPAKFGSNSMWTFAVRTTDVDGWREIQMHNASSPPPSGGSSYVLVPVVVTADTKAPADGLKPASSFTFEYVTLAGNIFSSTTCTAELPAPGGLHQLEVVPGHQSEFVACVLVPTADVVGGMWKATSTIDPQAAVYFDGPD